MDATSLEPIAPNPLNPLTVNDDVPIADLCKRERSPSILPGSWTLPTAWYRRRGEASIHSIQGHRFWEGVRLRSMDVYQVSGAAPICRNLFCSVLIRNGTIGTFVVLVVNNRGYPQTGSLSPTMKTCLLRRVRRPISGQRTISSTLTPRVSRAATTCFTLRSCVVAHHHGIAPQPVR